jgi:hypothetical protein
MGALRAKKGGRDKPDLTRLLCSQLVAVAYEQAGVSIVEGLSAQQVTPSALENAPKLRSISLPLQSIDSNSFGRTTTSSSGPIK